MSKESYKKKQKKYRIIIWGSIIIIIFSTWSIPTPLPKPEYVPTIVNGLVTSISILLAYTFFELAQTHARIPDVLTRLKFKLRTIPYLSALFGVMLVGILFGYRLVLVDDLGHAFSWFMSMFALMFGIVLDLPTEIDIA